MRELDDKYIGYSVKELLLIIEDKKSSSIVVYSAKKELESREISFEEIAQAKEELENERRSQNQETPDEDIPKKVSTWSSFLNLIHRSETRVEKMTTTIYLLLFLVVAVILIEFAENLLCNVMDGDILVKAVLIIGCLWRLGIIFLVAFLFYKKKKLGWILFLLYASYHFYSSFFDVFGYPSQLFLYILNIVMLLLHGGIMVLMCKKEVREIYRIDNTILYIILGFVALAFISRTMFLII
ncbi:MAG: hypothetical protein P4L28_09225 [Paludibacteraceae bacterium]|nr:hypothetical protein [Paludibacteraceae bacterium]